MVRLFQFCPNIKEPVQNSEVRKLSSTHHPLHLQRNKEDLWWEFRGQSAHRGPHDRASKEEQIKLSVNSSTNSSAMRYINRITCSL